MGTVALADGLGQLAAVTAIDVNIYYDPHAPGNAALMSHTFALTGGGTLAPVPEPSCLGWLFVALMRRFTRRPRLANHANAS